MTFEELRAAGFVEHHRCSACSAPVGFLIHPEMAAAVFDSGCNCGGPTPNYRVLTHQELAKIQAPQATPAPTLGPDPNEYEWNARYDAAWPVEGRG
jgi:hypothetical protein